MVGPATARAARHVASPSWSPRSRRSSRCPRRCAAGCCCVRNNPRNPPRPDPPAIVTPARKRPRAVMPIADRPTTMRTFFPSVAGKEAGRLKEKMLRFMEVASHYAPRGDTIVSRSRDAIGEETPLTRPFASHAEKRLRKTPEVRRSRRRPGRGRTSVSD